MTKSELFNPLNVSSKFAICGLPVRVDSYKTCSFGCKYCFSNGRKIMEFKKRQMFGNIKWMEKKLDNIHNNNKYSENNFLDNLIKDKYTWHCGGMSDPFQHIEKTAKITKKIINISKKYNHSILFSTKTDNVYECELDKDLHTFQFSITNIENNKKIEPGVPDIDKRYDLYRRLKDDGFKVGIRIQPFIPGISNEKIIDMFNDADYFTIEGLKLVPQNIEQKEYLLDLLQLDRTMFTQKGLLNLKPEIRDELYRPVVKSLRKYGIPFSLADNDFHDVSFSKCCCGEPLCKKTTSFNNTALFNKYGKKYDINDIYNELGVYKDCKAYQLFTSNRTEGCKTIWEFYQKRFPRKSSPFSKRFLYHYDDTWDNMED